MASTTGQEQVENLEEQEDAAVILTMLESTFQLVMTTTMTVGDHYRFSRILTWIEIVVMLSAYIVCVASITYSVCTKQSSWDYGFPWQLSVAVLLQVYMAVVYLAIRYLNLYLPQAPVAAWKALVDVGYKGVGSVATGVSFAAILLFDQAWLHIQVACLLGLLIAAVVAIWVWLDRTYGGAPVSGNK